MFLSYNSRTLLLGELLIAAELPCFLFFFFNSLFKLCSVCSRCLCVELLELNLEACPMVP